MKHYVEIFRFADDEGNALEKSEVARRMGPMSERQAERVCNGAEINLDHDHWAVRIVHEEEK